MTGARSVWGAAIRRLVYLSADAWAQRTGVAWVRRCIRAKLARSS